MGKDDHDTQINRRLFLKIIGWGSFFITLWVSIVGTVRFLFPRVLYEQSPIFKISLPDDFEAEEKFYSPGSFEIYEQWKEKHSVWIVREKNRIYALHAQCTHLGCTPNWFTDERVFKCPCHGSQFDSKGVNFAGPAPRPLDRFRIFIGDDGKIRIDKSKIYTHIEFNKEGAYVEV